LLFYLYTASEPFLPKANTHQKACTVRHGVFVDAGDEDAQIVLHATADHQAQALTWLYAQLHLQTTAIII
jgi:hypothetical protein